MAVDPVVPVPVHHLEVLNSDSQWSPAALGSRLCGVTRDSQDAGFPGKSCLLTGIRVVDDVERVVIALHDGEPDPVIDRMLAGIGIADVQAVPKPAVPSRRSTDPVGDFLKEIDVEDLCTRWNREDCLVSRAFRRSVGRQLRCSMKRSVARLERWYVGLGSLPETTQRHYSNIWNRVVDELSELNAPWVDGLLTRLEQIDPNPTPPPTSPTVAVEQPDFRHRRHADKPARLKVHVKRAKKRKRQNKKHSSAKVLVHKGVPAFS